MSQSGTTHDGGGGGSGKVAVQDLSITKFVDKASINLMRACCNGKHYDEALLTVRKSGENPVEYVKMKLNEVIITSVSTGGSGGEDRLTENVTVNFAKFETIYTEQGTDGSAGAESNLVFNIAENTEG